MQRLSIPAPLPLEEDPRKTLPTVHEDRELSPTSPKRHKWPHVFGHKKEKKSKEERAREKKLKEEKHKERKKEKKEKKKKKKKEKKSKVCEEKDELDNMTSGTGENIRILY